MFTWEKCIKLDWSCCCFAIWIASHLPKSNHCQPLSTGAWGPHWICPNKMTQITPELDATICWHAWRLLKDFFELSDNFQSWKSAGQRWGRWMVETGDAKALMCWRKSFVQVLFIHGCCRICPASKSDEVPMCSEPDSGVGVNKYTLWVEGNVVYHSHLWLPSM